MQDAFSGTSGFQLEPPPRSPRSASPPWRVARTDPSCERRKTKPGGRDPMGRRAMFQVGLVGELWQWEWQGGERGGRGVRDLCIDCGMYTR